MAKDCKCRVEVEHAPFTTRVPEAQGPKAKWKWNDFTHRKLLFIFLEMRIAKINLFLGDASQMSFSSPVTDAGELRLNTFKNQDFSSSNPFTQIALRPLIAVIKAEFHRGPVS